MKKAVKIVLCVLLAVVIIAGGVTYAVLPHSLNYDIKSLGHTDSALEIVDETEDSITVKKANGEVKVLMFTDMHLDGKNKTSNITLEHFVAAVEKEKPDLVILGGDNVTSALNKKRCEQFAQIFDNLGVYWAGVLGNHEGDSSFSVTRSEMMDIFIAHDYCLMKKGVADIDGDCNYSLNIVDENGKLVQTFFFMDTFDEMSDELKTQYNVPLEDDPYDGTRENQVAWYSDKVAKTKEQYGEFGSILVMHIPLPQMKAEAEKIENGEGEFLYGVKLEGVCASGFDSGLFDAIKAGGSTHSAYFGHDHINDFGIMYDGILLSYIQNSGWGSYTAQSKFGYEDKDGLQGYTVLNISADGTVDASAVRYGEGL